MGADYVSAARPSTGGAVYRADSASATLPTSTTGTLTGFTSLGYVSDAGIVNSNTASTTNVKAFGGDNVISLQTDKPDTFKFKLIEVLSDDVLKAVYGDTNVTGDLSTGITVNANTKAVEERAYVFDMILRDGTAKRIVVPRGQVQSVSDITYSDSECIGFELTILAIPDASGNSHYEYIKA